MGEQGGRIFFYDDKNWWSREGGPNQMRAGEPGGPDTGNVLYLPRYSARQSMGQKMPSKL